ncbi:MAG: DUF6473 family protein [Paracoccaceae bacterium]
MAYEHLGAGALDYYPCRYGASKLLFRGPRKKLDQPYCAVIGGTETYGKFVEEPFAQLLERMSEQPVVNLGYLNAGIDVFNNDQTVLGICAEAEVTVIQIMGAQNLTNRFYAVHKRRNDRFLKPSEILNTIYREMDFTDIHFTRHLLCSLSKASSEKFVLVRDEIRNAWVARMRSILSRIGGRVILLWLAEHSPDDAINCDPMGKDPLFVDRELIAQLAEFNVELVEIIATSEEVAAGQERLTFTQLEQPKAQEMLGPVVHEAAARALNECLATRHQSIRRA